MADESTRNVQLGVAVDSTKARAGFEEVSKSAQDMARSVEDSARKAGGGVDGVAKGSEQAAQRLDRSTKSIIAQIQRVTAEMQAGEKGSSTYFESLARQRGANVDALRPYLAQLDAAKSKQNEFSQSLMNTGMSARATAAALRTVPAQFTDIVTSLQSGQAPLTVLLQQGGQLKDQFGGVGAAAQALGRYVAGLVNPFTVAAGALGALAFAAYQGSEEFREFQKTLILSGDRAGVTADQLMQIAEAIDEMNFGISQSKAAAVLNEIVRSGVRGEDQLRRYTEAAAKFEKAGGGAAEEVAKAFKALADDPLGATLKFNEALGYVTESTYKQIKALVDQGRTADAAKLAQDEYFTALTSITPKLEANLGSLQRAWRALAGTASEAWSKMLGIGRAETAGDRIADIERRLRERATSAPAFGETYAQREQETQRLRQELFRLRTEAARESLGARDRGEAAQREKERIAFLAAGDKFLDSEAKKQKEIAQIQQLRLRNVISEAEAKERIAKIEQSYAKGGSSRASGGRSTENRELKEQADLLATLSGVNRDYVEQLASVQSMRESGLITEQQSIDLLIALIEKQPMARDLMNEQAEATKRLAQEQAALAKAEQDRINAAERSATGVQDQVQKLLDEERALTIAAASNISLAQAIEEVNIARLREQQAQLMKEGDRDAEVLAIQKEIDARKQLQQAIGRQESRDEAKKAADEAAKEWQKTAETVESSLTDALMRGFESGKSLAENFKDALVNSFKTLILRPIIQPITQGIAGAVSSLFGGGGGSVGGIASSLLGGGGSPLAGIAGVSSALGGGLQAGFGALLNGGGVQAISAGVTTALTGGTAGTFAAGIGTALGAALPVVGIVAAAGKLFDKKLKEQGFGVAFSEGVAGAAFNYSRRSSILGGSSSGRIPSNDPAAFAFANQAQSIVDASKSMAGALGVAAEGIGLYTGEIKVNLKGAKDAEEAQRRMTAALDDLQFATLQGAAGFDMTRESFGALMDGVRTDIADAGISADGLADIIAQGMIGRLSQAQVGEQLSDVIVGGIYNSIASNYAAQIAQAFTAQIITPIFTALAAGVPISQAISQQAIANVVATAQQAAAALNAIFNDAGFKAAIAGVEQAIGGVASAATSVKVPKIGSARSVRGAASGPSPAQIEADRIAKEREGLERQLLQLQGDTVELRRRELQELDPSNRALQERIWALEEEQRISQEREGLEVRLLELLGQSAILRERERAALDASNRALFDQITALEFAQGAADSALSSLRNAVDAQKESLQESFDKESEALRERISTIADVVNELDSAIKSIRGSIEPLTIQSQTAARLTLQSIVTAVRGGSDVTVFKDAITQAVGTLSENDPQLYATQIEFARAQAQSAALLDSLKGLGDDQLSTAEKQLKTLEDGFRKEIDRLDQLVENAQKQIDASNGIREAVLSVEQAVLAVSAAIANLNLTKTSSSAAAGVIPNTPASTFDLVQQAYASIGRTGIGSGVNQIDLAGFEYWNKQLATGAVAVSDFQKSFESAVKEFVSSNPNDPYAEYIKQVRGFASGGMHVGGLRIVGENGPELEATGPARIWSAEQTQRMLSGSANDELVAEVRQLRKEMAEMKSAAAATARNSNDTVKILQRVTNGGNAMLTEAVA